MYSEEGIIDFIVMNSHTKWYMFPSYLYSHAKFNAKNSRNDSLLLQHPSFRIHVYCLMFKPRNWKTTLLPACLSLFVVVILNLFFIQTFVAFELTHKMQYAKYARETVPDINISTTNQFINNNYKPIENDITFRFDLVLNEANNVQYIFAL